MHAVPHEHGSGIYLDAVYHWSRAGKCAVAFACGVFAVACYKLNEVITFAERNICGYSVDKGKPVDVYRAISHPCILIAAVGVEHPYLECFIRDSDALELFGNSYRKAGVIDRLAAGNIEFERNTVSVKVGNRRTMFMPDQSALNDLAESKLVLPRRFNEQRAIRDDTVIKHFCRWFRIYPLWARMLNYKQWQVDEVHKKLKIHDFDDIYDDIKELEKKYALE